MSSPRCNIVSALVWVFVGRITMRFKKFVVHLKLCPVSCLCGEMLTMVWSPRNKMSMMSSQTPPPLISKATAKSAMLCRRRVSALSDFSIAFVSFPAGTLSAKVHRHSFHLGNLYPPPPRPPQDFTRCESTSCASTSVCVRPIQREMK